MFDSELTWKRFLDSLEGASEFKLTIDHPFGLIGKDDEGKK